MIALAHERPGAVGKQVQRTDSGWAGAPALQPCSTSGFET
jgi:hypothetical protein